MKRFAGIDSLMLNPPVVKVIRESIAGRMTIPLHVSPKKRFMRTADPPGRPDVATVIDEQN